MTRKMIAMQPTRLFFSIALCFCLAAVANTEDAKPAKTSSFAPLKPTMAQLDYFMSKIGKDLATEDEYGDAEQKRVGLDASTVVVLGMTLGTHDEKNPLKASAGKIASLAAELAENADDREAATKVYESLKTTIKEKSESEEAAWDEPIADLAMLMQQVPIVNDGLRRGVNDKRRFARNAQRVAPKAVTLAAIAHASMLDTNYCSDEEDEKAWKAICIDMRDACADVYAALMAKDQKKAKEGNARVVESCDACHHKFRD